MHLLKKQLKKKLESNRKKRVAKVTRFLYIKYIKIILPVRLGGNVAQPETKRLVLCVR